MIRLLTRPRRPRSTAALPCDGHNRRGAILVLAYFVVGIWSFYIQCKWVKGADFPDFMRRWGWARFGLTAFLWVNMWAVVVKMVLRHLFNIKYVMVFESPYFSINI